MSGRRGAQFGDVYGLRKVHLEERALAEGKRNCVLRVLPGFLAAAPTHLPHHCVRPLHGRFVFVPRPRRLQFRRNIEAVGRRKILHDLHAAPVAVHVAEPANVHQDVESELLPRGKSAQHLIVFAAIAQAEINDFPASCIPRRNHRLANLPVRIMTVLVKERRCELNLDFILIEQIHQRRRPKRSALHQVRRRLLKLAPGFHLVGTRVRILHQRGRDPHLAQQFGFRAIGKFRRNRANLSDQRAQRLLVRVIRGRNRRFLQQPSQVPDLFMGMREQMRDLRFQRAGVDDFSQRRIGGQWQEIARNVECPRPQRALVRILLHVGGLGCDPPQILKHRL